MNKVVVQKPYKPYIIFDLDGTLCNVDHRLHYISGDEKDWGSFNAACKYDVPYTKIEAIYRKMCNDNSATNFPAIFMSGREEKYRKETEFWLNKFRLIPDNLLMREIGDYRSDVDVKKELLQKYVREAPVLFILEDRSKVVKMWRSIGLTCLQVKEGDY